MSIDMSNILLESEDSNSSLYPFQSSCFFLPNMGFNEENKVIPRPINNNDNNTNLNPPIKSHHTSMTSNTSEKKSSKLLNKKRKLRLFRRNDEKKVESIEINISRNHTKCGRRKIGEIVEKRHNKRSKDNIMRTIKVFVRKYIFAIIKNNYKDFEKLKKIDSKFNQNLKKDYNIELFKTTLKDIFINTELSKKYKHYPKDANEKLINKIYEENKEIALIKILNLTYGEVFEIFMRKITKDKIISPELEQKIEGTNILENNELRDIDALIKIKEKESLKNGDNQESIEEYKQEIKDLCLDFQGWFDRKIGRKRFKKI
jgi:hypothetical protein